MFRCDACENYYDNSECMPDKANETNLICWDCYADRYICLDCGGEGEYSKYLDYTICDDCSQKLEVKYV